MNIIPLQAMNQGSHFRADILRDPSAAIAPFLGVDHAWMSAPTFPLHQHVGISAVSYVFEDTQTPTNNQDSLGNHNHIHAGGLHWMVAGRGIRHQEDPLEMGKTVHQLQIFVDLDEVHKSQPPFVLSLAPQDVPVVALDGATVRVPLGRFGEAQSPITPPTEVNLFDIALNDGATLSVHIPVGHNSFVMVIAGTVSVNGQDFSPEQPVVPVFAALSEPQSLTLKARHGKTQVVVFSGTPV